VIEGGRTASSAALRTYTVRRVVVVVVLALLAVVALRAAALGVSAAVAPSATATNGAVAEVVHTTRPGDTLWGVAIRYAPEVDPRIAIDDLIALNGGAALQVGQRVLLPAEWF
jgi:LysM repeat protein